MNKKDTAAKFPDKLKKWQRKPKKSDRDKDRDERIAKWEGRK